MPQTARGRAMKHIHILFFEATRTTWHGTQRRREWHTLVATTATAPALATPRLSGLWLCRPRRRRPRSAQAPAPRGLQRGGRCSAGCYCFAHRVSAPRRLQCGCRALLLRVPQERDPHLVESVLASRACRRYCEFAGVCWGDGGHDNHIERVQCVGPAQQEPSRTHVGSVVSAYLHNAIMRAFGIHLLSHEPPRCSY